ncbi:ribosomal S5 Elongation factor G III V family [Chlorella sorokiniana]|uniref:Ribosome assembly protein 1 n=1 Tax=Chlorella sorokiniana TaxID=3076 RepID=A0A2P6TFI6_CHLSO|nr:ribosomal S5 Elongation factor G III V family [Chlorella sorokiniana]|eukprot:PRW32859.1 ribosomal S5 Elongation factor G III V family [Chlorella sorokiniana]
MNVDLGLISELQNRTDRIRNVCVLAHVDHGKTTLSDHLIASNGLIHPKLAGEVRYMDSKDDEQARGITMKSSSISLLFVPGAATRADGPNAVPREERLEKGYLFNLIDSPGHVDFCSEVSTAARLSDGAFVVVDAVEGVCIQTHAVLRQAWEEKVKLCLVVNKIDRLILELCLTPLEAYERLKAIIAHVNMIVSSFHSEKYISEADAVLAYEEAKADGTAQRLAEGGGGGDGEEEEEEEEQAFAPERGNVVFGSAYDGWAFRINQFAEMYAAKMGCKAAALQRALWGDFAYQPKTKRIVRIKSDQQGRAKPLFVQLALEPIWKAYGACEQGADHTAILGRIVQGLGLSSITPRVLQHPDARAALRSVLRAWLPLSEAVLSMAAEHLPSPIAAAPERYARLLPPRPEQLKAAAAEEGGAELAASLDAVEGAVRQCDTATDAPLVLYVSKMVAVPAAALPRLPGEPGPAHPAEERFLAFGRVFSGVIRQGQTVQVLPATYNPADPASERQEVAVGALFLMMGRGLERLPEVPAGNILALAGLDLAILKSATVASTPLCRPLAPMLFQSAPIVRVAVEPARPGDMPALVEGLRLLHRADPMVQVAVQETGEHVLCAAGEVHLETCIKDLKERFARCELVVSPPLVAFRETVFCKEEAPLETTARPVFAVEASTPSGACTLRVMALPLPAPVATALDQNADLLRLALEGAAKGAAGGGEQQAAQQQGAAGTAGAAAAEADVGGGTGAPGSDSLAALGERLRTVAAAAEQEGLLAMLQRAWMFGPKRVGPNLLLAAPGGSTDAAASSLFNLPPERVVKLAKQQPGRTALLPSAGRPESAASDAVDGGEYEEQEAQEQRYLAVPLGFPEAALKLGLASSNETAAAHAAAAVADLSSQLGAMDVSAAGGAGAAVAAPANGSAAADGAAAAAAGGSLGSSLEYLRYSVESGVASGFQMAAAAGPLCDEPLWGVAIAVEARFNLPPGAAGGEGCSAAEAAAQLHLAEDVYGPFSGQVTSAARQALRRAVLEADPRLVEALFLCEVATSSEGLSAVYAVLGRRRARILREEMREGSDLFTVHAYLPAEASFGFADELRRRSSGAATASLMLSHWERLQVDPFFVPLTEEEREEFGEEGQGVGSANLAKRLIDAVRRRKGLPVEEKVVESATKQRTRARKV